MDKVAYYKDQIEKMASARWRKFLNEANSFSELRQMLGSIMRNDVGDVSSVRSHLKYPNTYSDLLEESESLAELKIRAKQLFSANDKALSNKREYFQGKKTKPFLKDLKIRRRVDSRNARMPIEDSEEYMPIMHGSEYSRIQAFISGGNSAYTVPPMNLGGTVSKKGIFVHSNIGLRDRVPFYAYRSSAVRGGEPAILTGRIKKKYVYHNNSSSGQGDEFLIPKKYYDKIEDVNITRSNSEEWFDKGDVLAKRIGHSPFKY